MKMLLPLKAFEFGKLDGVRLMKANDGAEKYSKEQEYDIILQFTLLYLSAHVSWFGYEYKETLFSLKYLINCLITSAASEIINYPFTQHHTDKTSA
jgi:hypothetical protein